MQDHHHPRRRRPDGRRHRPRPASPTAPSCRSRRSASADVSRPRIEALIAELGDPPPRSLSISTSPTPPGSRPRSPAPTSCINARADAARPPDGDLRGVPRRPRHLYRPRRPRHLHGQQMAMHERFRAAGVAGGDRHRRRSRHVQRHLPGRRRRARHDRPHQPLLGGRAGRPGEPGAGPALFDLDRARRICPSEHAVPRRPASGAARR